MYCKLALATLAVIIGSDFGTAKYIPAATTAAELWNPLTWFWPFARAFSESNRDYFQKSQEASNELYLQVYKTNAFPWVTGEWDLPDVFKPNGGQNNNQTTDDGLTQGYSKKPAEVNTNQENKTPEEDSEV